MNITWTLHALAVLCGIIATACGLQSSANKIPLFICFALVAGIFELTIPFLKTPLVLSPSIYTVSSGLQSKFILKLTNTVDYPFFNIAVRIRVEEGDINAHDIKVLPIEKPIVNSDLGGITIHHDIFGFTYVDKDGKSVAQYNVYEIDGDDTNKYEVKIKTDMIEKKAKLSFAVVSFDKEPKEIVRTKSHSGYFDKGNSFAKEKQYLKAIENYEKAIAHGGKSAKISLNWGNVLFESEDYDNAILKYQEAIEIDPTCVNAFFNLGVAYLKKEKMEDAIKSFQKVIEIDPHSEFAKKSSNVIKLMNRRVRPFVAANRIITMKQKSKIVDVLLKNRGNISISYVRGDRNAEQYAQEIRDIFNTAYWHTSIDGANFAGFDRGLIVSANKMSDRIEVIITAFDAGDINIKPWINSNMKERELELKVGSP